VTDLQFRLSNDYTFCGWALNQTGNSDEAMTAFERAIAIMQKLADANPTVAPWRSQLALNLVFIGSLKKKAGRSAETVASLRRAVSIWETQSSRTPVDLYNLACSHAILAALASEPGSGMTAADRRDEADRAMGWLREAISAGYRILNIMQSDTDLDALRSRIDFQLLMMDLTIPAEPFASGR
jgi:tetratricopeptide (TPR) repeat protein